MGEIVYCHKPEISLAMEPIPLWFAKTLCVGDFFEKKLGTVSGKFCRKTRRKEAKVKATRLTVCCLESCREFHYLYLTDGTNCYRMKLVEGKKCAFLMDFGTGDHSRWVTSYEW